MVTDAPSQDRPAQLCGYSVVETLAPGSTYLAIGPGGRGVALKRLDPDCLHQQLLHPDIRDRLSRIRELAHAGVANLVGVGKDSAGGDAWLIWEFVEGKPLAAYARERCPSQRELAALLREVVLTVESLHMQGIVHGAIHSGNVIVAPEGAVRLTHVSPLLYTDPAEDAESIIDTALAILDERGERESPLGSLMTEARETNMPLRALATRLAVLADAKEPAYEPAAAVARRESRTRKRAVFGAFVAALAGVAIAYEVWRRAGRPGADSLPAWLLPP
jgi:hypothetical protein